MGLSLICYATKQDLADYLFCEIDELPLDADRQLTRASEIVQTAMLDNYIDTDAKHIQAAKLATCAQVEYWLELGETPSTIGSVKSFNVSGVSVTLSEDTEQLSKRSKLYLNKEGLMYRAIKNRKYRLGERV